MKQIIIATVCVFLVASNAFAQESSKGSASVEKESTQKAPRPTSRPRKAPKHGRVNYWGGKYKNGVTADMERLVRARPQIDTIQEMPIARRMEFWLTIFVESSQIDDRILHLMQNDIEAMPTLCQQVITKLSADDEVGTPSLIALLTEHASHDNYPQMHKLFNEGNDLVRFSCSQLLRSWGLPESYNVALAMLQDKNQGIQLNGAALLGEIADPSSVPILIALAGKSTDIRLKHEITRALGTIGDARAFTLLHGFYMQDKNKFLQRTAGQAICRISGTDAKKFMQQAWQNQSDPRIRLAALEGMHRLGLRSTEQLLEVAEIDSVHPWLREQALRKWAQLNKRSAANQLLGWVEQPTNNQSMAGPALLALQEVDLSQHSARVLQLLSQPSAPERSRALYDALVKSLQQRFQG